MIMTKLQRCCMVALAWAALGSSATAQEALSPGAAETMLFFNPPLDPLVFSPTVKELGLFSALGNTVFKPDHKAMPYPLVLVGHTCGGIGRPHIRERMKELLAAGFAVMAVDSFGPRGVRDCRGQTKVRAESSVMDAYAALTHVSKLPEIDTQRVYYTGYSWGGTVGPMLASPSSAKAFQSALRFRAIVSNYGACWYQHTDHSPRHTFLYPDIDRPLLMLMAGEDLEFKPAECVNYLEELRAAGKPVQWHVYPGTHHAWDQSDLYHHTVTTGRGEPNLYRYSREATEDSTRRMIELFRQHP